MGIEDEILAGIRSAGVEINSIYELSELRRYDQAIPVLQKWLPLIASHRVKSIVLDALAVPWAVPSSIPLLMREFRRTAADSPDDELGFRWNIGSALEAVYSDSAYSDYVELVLDAKYGRSREMPVLALRKTKEHKEDAEKILLSLFGDPSVSGHAVEALVKLGPTEVARTALESKTSDKRKWVSRNANKGLQKIQDRRNQDCS